MLISGELKVVGLSIVPGGTEVVLEPVQKSRLNAIWATNPNLIDLGYRGEVAGRVTFTINNPDILSQLKIGMVHRFALGVPVE